jgi:hypothetical protein
MPSRKSGASETPALRRTIRVTGSIKKPSNRVTRVHTPPPNEGDEPQHSTRGNTAALRLDNLAEEVTRLTNENDEFLDAIDEIKEKFDGFEDKFDRLERRISALLESQPGPATGARIIPDAISTSSGMKPLDFVQSRLSWVDATTLTQIIAGTLDAAHLIKLIPSEDRPKGQQNAGLPTGYTIDLETGRHSLTTDQNVVFERHFPDFPLFVQAVSVYGAIRGFYDTDHLGFGPAIAMHVRQIATWVCQGLPWTGVLSYAIAHFRKYQPTRDPSKWMDIDIQLYMTHISRATQLSFRAERKKEKKTVFGKEICNNWNDASKGCKWTKCSRLHHCSQCSSDGHEAFKCPKGAVSSK